MNLIEKIEALRLRQGLTKTEMASQFGVIFQNYNNWIARSSLPKEHYEKAHQLLQKDSIRESQGEYNLGDSLMDLWESSPEEEREKFLRALISKR